MINIKEIYDNIEDSYMEITKKYIAISEHNFQEAMGNHPSTFAFFAGVMAYAKKEVDRANLICETREAELREARREEMRQAGQKTTDRALDAYLKTQPELQTLQRGIVSKAHKFNLCKNIVSSLDHQKDIIIQLSANKRAEAKLIEQL
tara:strand:- start:6376 stop:6819 length:444 start_codon:yes stop_codon:yes gene_type:complete